jgi:DNA-binding GntR family transcriptional regulator
VFTQHRGILDALERGDVAGAELRITEHLEEARDRLLRYLETQGDGVEVGEEAIQGYR